MVTQGKVHLDEPVRELLPAGTVAKPAGSSKDQEITLLDLVTHHSGLPSIPSNFYPADPTNPYADYAPQDLYAYVAKRGVRKPADVTFVYSNLGVGLLGQALAVRAGRSYADLLREEITGPLGLADTVVDFSAEQRRRFMQGYDDGHRRVRAWDLDALAGAGAIRSTAGDMLTYLEANLHPEKFAGLSSAMTLSHQIRESADEGGQIALAWLYSRASDGIYWHGGATAGFTSDVFFNPREDCAAVVLMNSGPNLLLRADVIGEHIRQRLSGQPAISLETVLVPASRGLRGLLRSFCAYWFTMLAAGVFVYGAVLGAQGLAAQILPRKFFLRVSGHLQLAAICLIVGMYFLQPGFGGLDDLTVGSIWRIFQWLPSYCFLALYQQLNGSMHPALEPMARRAWMGLGCVVFGTGVVYTLSYWRTLRKIVEEPDIVPGRQRFGWLPRFGNHTQTAIGQFSVRTLARSKQHRLILCFYLGVGLAFTSLLLKGSKAAVNNPWRERSMLLWAASIMMMVLASFGTRVAFAMPLDLRANWIFRVTGARGGLENLEASRRALLLLSVTPVWVVTAIVCLGLWPGRQSAAHLIVLAFAGLIVADICLLRFQKIPFTCSYLPGKSRVHIAFLGSLGVLLVGTDAAQLERHALREIGSTMVMLAVLFAVWICVRYATEALAKREEQELRFEEETAPAVLALGLYRDGVMPIVNEPATRTT